MKRKFQVSSKKGSTAVIKYDCDFVDPSLIEKWGLYFLSMNQSELMTNGLTEENVAEVMLCEFCSKVIKLHSSSVMLLEHSLLQS